MSIPNITWLDPAMVEAYSAHGQPPRNPYATGYGRKIPTAYSLHIAGRWHRVYAMCYGNISTLYVRKGGEELVLDHETEYVLGAYSRGEIPRDEIIHTIRRFDTHRGAAA